MFHTETPPGLVGEEPYLSRSPGLVLINGRRIDSTLDPNTYGNVFKV